MAHLREASVTLPSDPASVGTARRYVTGVLAGWGLSERSEEADVVRLIVSELATNAVQHTRGRSPVLTVEVRLERDAWLRIGVTDGHPRLPRRPSRPDRPDNGRGLLIVRTLTAAAGGRFCAAPAAGGGKTVWALLPWTSPAGGS
ncbi:ATP-binding protein [Streptomyces sp. NPDC059506]|uniref:ATP-binding protein n=1 Tax=Streptomyces TaxID=1883 RepID=UPI000CC757F6|nr:MULTISPECIES: ATP-binding protein [unclassified Streptomyces]MCZ2523467.1 ATP-binding protein [Streptomyces sp. HB2AG]PLW71111.1 ATP-binding protein [Streptomyces sp. DJ]QMV20601.1 ATP-binding protein [Streptomyces sp. SCUT-3]